MIRNYVWVDRMNKAYWFFVQIKDINAIRFCHRRNVVKLAIILLTGKNIHLFNVRDIFQRIPSISFFVFWCNSHSPGAMSKCSNSCTNWARCDKIYCMCFSMRFPYANPIYLPMHCYFNMDKVFTFKIPHTIN